MELNRRRQPFQGRYVTPDERGAYDLIVLIEHDRAMHLTEKPTHATSFPRNSGFASAPLTAIVHARHQSSGDCSAQPMFGEPNGACSSVDEAMSLPRSLTTRARVPPVPTSIPRT